MQMESTNREEVASVLSPWFWPVLVIVAVASAGALGPGWALLVVAAAAWAAWARLRRGDQAVPTARPTVQPLVFCLVEYDGKLLVREERDEVSGRTVWRPPGGTIAFGERAE